MLIEKTRRRIKNNKWTNHSNPAQFISRINTQVEAALSDLTLLANELDEKHLEKLFSEKKLEPFIKALMSPISESKISNKKKNKERTFFLGYMLLKWSLNITGSALDNKWAKKLYQHHELPLRDLLDSLYHEKIEHSPAS